MHQKGFEGRMQILLETADENSGSISKTMSVSHLRQPDLINVPSELAASIARAAKIFPSFSENELLQPEVRFKLRKALRASCSEGYTEFVHGVVQRLKQPPFFALINGMEFDCSNRVFAGLITEIGDIVEPNRKPQSKVIREIRPKTDLSKQSKPLNEYLHTDGTDWKVPNDLTCLLCVTPDSGGGGRTRILSADDLVHEISLIDSSVVRILKETNVPWKIADYLGGGVHKAPILAKGEIRWLRYTIDLALEENSVRLSEEVWNAICFFSANVEGTVLVYDFAMAAGDLLIANNKRCLHARTPVANAEGSGRLLLRIKANFRGQR